MTPVLRAAHCYISHLGWAVLPCFGKAPAQPEKAGGHGWLSATRDHEEIDRTWDHYAANSIGVACKPSGFFALDVDPRDGGNDTLRELESKFEPLPLTVRQLTGGGGEHILFRPPSEDWRPVGSLGFGIQVKWAGYIVAAPSLHEKTGRPYAWSVDHHPLEIPIAATPEWLIPLATAPKAGSPVDWTKVETLDVRTGDRTSTLTRLAGLLFRKRVDMSVAFSLLWAWNAQACKPPLPLKKFEGTLSGMWKREQCRRTGA
jgi:hypothetical protein